MNKTKSRMHIPINDQIRLQAGRRSVELFIAVSREERRIVLSRKQADAVLAGRELVIDPISMKHKVRR